MDEEIDSRRRQFKPIPKNTVSMTEAVYPKNLSQIGQMTLSLKDGEKELSFVIKDTRGLMPGQNPS